VNKKTKYLKFYYECINCTKQYDDAEIRYLCPECSIANSIDQPPKGVLKILYNYQEIVNCFSEYKKRGFIDLLPLNSTKSLPKLRIGNTPLFSRNHLSGKDLPFKLFLKDDSQNPTYSFKDRASSIVSAYAKEQGIETIIAASTGNAGSSMAGLCAAQQQKAIVIVPDNAPVAKLAQIIMYGAKVIPVKGTYDDAFELSIEATKEYGYYNRNTAYNPLTIEGKKTVSFELFEQLSYKVPDNIFVPVGDGVIISGVYKGFEDLLTLGLTDKMPTVIAVQSEGSDNLVRNITGDRFTIRQSMTIADSISVDVPRNFYMTRQFIEKYKGESASVTDEEVLSASSTLSKNTGLFAEPAAAAAFAGFLNHYKNNKIADYSSNVVLLTGSGLKDLKGIRQSLQIPESIRPELQQLKKALS
jgi:threonine synthase